MENRKFRSWLEISKKNLIHNHKVFKKIAAGKKVACVVKANAYGHGLNEVVGLLSDEADWFAVDDLDEALAIRALGVKTPILVLGYTLSARLHEAVENDIAITVYNLSSLKVLANTKGYKKARIHIKIETGLNRQGVDKEQIVPVVKFIISNKDKIFLEGLSTHFANIEDTPDSAFAREQLSRFGEVIKLVERLGVKAPLVHCAASAAALLYQETHFDMIRAGIGLYGLWPSRETEASLLLSNHPIVLKPVMSLKCIVAQVKRVRRGESVGYGREWHAPKESRVAIIPVGYSDGYDRGLSNVARALINGKNVPVVGRVAMNMLMLDISQVSGVKEGSEVVLLGRSGKEEVTADELAVRIGTINYEVVARMNPNLPRVIV